MAKSALDKLKSKIKLKPKTLVGKQKNLDVNKNGKLDAQDFKILRGDEMAKGGELKSLKEYLDKLINTLPNSPSKANKNKILKEISETREKIKNLESKDKMAEGGEIKFVKTKFNSHQNHNPSADILEGHLDKDSYITYVVYIKDSGRAKAGEEFMEYYIGENYKIGSNKKSHSRVYSVDKIPAKYKKAWEELKSEYNEKYKDSMAEGGETKVAKFKVEDMVYSYQNKDYAAPINYVKFSPWDSNAGSHPNDTYKYRLSLKDGKGHSNWIDEKSLYKTKQKEYAKGGEVSEEKMIQKLTKQFEGKDLWEDEILDDYEVKMFDFEQEEEMEKWKNKNSKKNYIVPFNSEDDSHIFILVPKNKMEEGGETYDKAQFKKELAEFKKHVKDGYGWISPDYVIDSWKNMGLETNVSNFKSQATQDLFKDLIDSDLLYHEEYEGNEEQGEKIESFRELYGFNYGENVEYAKGGTIAQENNDMLQSNIKEIKHHADELKDIVTNKTEVEPWVIAKTERASTDLSDVTHYLDGEKDKSLEMPFEKGGYMADGGELSGLTANIYRSDYDSPTNKMYGKSNVTIIDKEVPEIFKSDESRPAVRLIRRKFRFGSDEYEYIHAVPYNQSDSEGMFGGTFIYSSDSRFPSKYPIPLHDRVEMEKGGYMAEGGNVQIERISTKKDITQRSLSESEVRDAIDDKFDEIMLIDLPKLTMFYKQDSESSNLINESFADIKAARRKIMRSSSPGDRLMEKGGYMAKGGMTAKDRKIADHIVKTYNMDEPGMAPVYANQLRREESRLNKTYGRDWQKTMTPADKVNKFLDAVRLSDNSIKLKDITVEASPRGNWVVFEHGKVIMTVNHDMLDEETIRTYNLEHHN